MEIEARVCDDEVMLVESRESSVQVKRVLPGFCALALLAVGGMGGRAVWNSARVSEATSLHSHHHWHDYWYNYWHGDSRYSTDYWQNFHERYPRFDELGCSWDGHDCGQSRCCARQGSRCYVKDSRWASCNETCLSFTKWEGSYHHGHWVHTHYPVWDCTDITAETLAVDAHAEREEVDADVVEAQEVEAVAAPQAVEAQAVAFHHAPERYPPPPEFWPSPEYYTATAYGGCQEDGLDCRYSRCCARQGSRCFVKDDRWASCNESCFSFTQWEGHHRHGHWKRTNFPVWDCTDITEEA